MGRLFLMKKIDENGNVWYSITVPVRDWLKNELFPLRFSALRRSGLKGFHICFRNAENKKERFGALFSLQKITRLAFKRFRQL